MKEFRYEDKNSEKVEKTQEMGINICPERLNTIDTELYQVQAKIQGPKGYISQCGTSLVTRRN